VPLGGVRQSLTEALKSWTYILTISGVYELRLYTPTGVTIATWFGCVRLMLADGVESHFISHTLIHIRAILPPRT
jgi:hypothetical protein